MLNGLVRPDKDLILVTGHRRENHGEGFLNI
jgi:UDP-N-acetylglucosamine 2-epimerase